MYKTYTLDNLVIGKSNHIAFRSIENSLTNMGVQNNPLTLYGASGSGKTYLAHIWMKHVVQARQSAIHLSAMEFIDQYVFALSNQTEDEFRNDIIKCDLLIIDDLQHFVGRFGSQDELCLILDQRIANDKQTIFTSSKHPKSLDWNSLLLESRLLSGLNIELQLPDTSMQIQILKKKLMAVGVEISEDLLARAIENTNGNGWIIEGVAKQIFDMSMQRIEINENTVVSLLQV